MRFICVIIVACGIVGILSADSPINTDKILKSNQAVVFNAKTNTISYVLEIGKDGKITKKFLSDIEKQKIMESMNLSAHSEIKQNFGANNSTKKASANKPKVDKYPNSHIKEWDKSKIIYEQVVDKIYILR